MIRNLALGVLLVLAACTTSTSDTSGRSDIGSEVALRVAFWDYTRNGVVEQPRIELRGGSDPWLPETGRYFNKRRFSGLKPGTTETFEFFPFGNAQLVMRVDVPITDELCPSSCVADTLNFGIWDDHIGIWGVVPTRIVRR
jgi:hypothetical protein